MKSNSFSDLTLNCCIMKSRLAGSKGVLKIRESLAFPSIWLYILAILWWNSFFLLNKIIYLFLIALGLHCFVWAFSSFREWGPLILIALASPVVELRLWVVQASVVMLGELSSCSSQVWGQKLGYPGLVAPKHVGSSRTRDQTCVSCVGRQILYRWATREALWWNSFIPVFNKQFSSAFNTCFLRTYMLQALCWSLRLL